METETTQPFTQTESRGGSSCVGSNHHRSLELSAPVPGNWTPLAFVVDGEAIQFAARDVMWIFNRNDRNPAELNAKLSRGSKV
jgi:hypothetical protein